MITQTPNRMNMIFKNPNTFNLNKIPNLNTLIPLTSSQPRTLRIKLNSTHPIQMPLPLHNKFPSRNSPNFPSKVIRSRGNKGFPWMDLHGLYRLQMPFKLLIHCYVFCWEWIKLCGQIRILFIVWWDWSQFLWLFLCLFICFGLFCIFV